ncbi:MAG TPA: hypothetical protein VGP72_14785 [Planctomycetota bacterium]
MSVTVLPTAMSAPDRLRSFALKVYVVVAPAIGEDNATDGLVSFVLAAWANPEKTQASNTANLK